MQDCTKKLLHDWDARKKETVKNSYFEKDCNFWNGLFANNKDDDDDMVMIKEL